METAFLPKHYTGSAGAGAFSWTAPSNIALVKYWGKKPHQLPANPSLSLTLSKCLTQTKLAFEPKSGKGCSFDLMLDGQPKDSFRPKIETFFSRILPYMPFLEDFHFTIDTHNTFPHSSGIASSASGMAALALNLMSVEKMLQPELAHEDFFRKASFLARLGSGSACRSVRGEVVVWGEHRDIPGSSDFYGAAFPFEIHKIFHRYQDTVLLIDRGEKQVSSSAGHDLMHGHPFAAQRFEQAHTNLSALSEALQSGDLEAFVRITESEALTLHAMMMASQPYFMLMRPNTLEVIQKIWRYRREEKLPVCFTLDAGANVHLLYPENVSAAILQFIKSELVGHCENGAYICDEVGPGAKKIVD